MGESVSQYFPDVVCNELYSQWATSGSHRFRRKKCFVKTEEVNSV